MSTAATTTPDGLPPLREVIAAAGLRARKSLGQNFILDLNLTRRIARIAGPLAGAVIVEIGPGPGGLTRALLLEGAERVIAIERDERCVPALEQIAARYPGRLDIVMGDALAIDAARLLPEPHGPVRIAANLPYGIATALLVKWLSVEPWPPWYERMVLMFQREVAERLVAAPGGKAYGRLAVLAQWRCEVRIALKLPPAAFTPPPKVASALVTLTPRAEPLPAGSLAALERVSEAAFGKRRKMLRSSLAGLAVPAEILLDKAGIEPTRRAEQLSVAEFCRLAQVLAEAGGA